MQDYIQLGAVAIIFLFCAKEFFSYLKSKKTSGTNGWMNVVDEIKTLNSNHLHSIEESMNSGNDRVVAAISNMHQDLKGVLCEIRGKLSK